MNKFLLIICIALCLPAMGQENSPVLNEQQKFRVTLNGGYSLRLAQLSEDIPADMKDYTRKLKSGLSIGMDASYLFGESWGLGLKYSRFNSSESMGNMQVTYDDGSFAQGSISDDITINYIGPNFLHAYQLFNPRHNAYGRLGLGYLSYNDDAVWVDRRFEYKGATIGYNVDIGYEYAINKYFSLGAQISVLGGTLSKFDVIEGRNKSTVELQEGKREGLGRLDVGGGLRFSI